jgi:sec-independent protein translocase protein TatB
MLNIGMPELAIIGVVALIVVGPKDLPIMFRKAGQMVGKARGMARDFTRAMESAADDAGMSDLKKTVEDAANVGSDFKDYAKSFGRDDDTDGDAVKKANENSEKVGKEFAAIKAERAAEAEKKAAEKKPATKKPAAKKPAVKKSAAKKPAAKAPAKKTAAKKPAAKAAAKPAAKKTTKAKS